MLSAKYIKVDGQVLKLTHVEKIFYPQSSFKKGDVIDYYKQIGPTALPHLFNRPFTLKRYPSGVEGERFYEKNCPSHRPGWVRTTKFDSTNYCLINDLKTLLWSANLAAIELHTTLATIQNLQSPTFIVLDLDPGESAGIRECAEVALRIRRLLTKLELDSYPKTSGKKGLHVCIPINQETDYSETTPFARWIAEYLQHLAPSEVTAKMSKKLRIGRVFIDWSQNVDFKTTVTVYSLRAASRPTVSTPVSWSEVEAASKKDSAAAILSFEAPDVIRRIRKSGDLFVPVLRQVQQLPPQSALARPRFRLKAA